MPQTRANAALKVDAVEPRLKSQVQQHRRRPGPGRLSLHLGHPQAVHVVKEIPDPAGRSGTTTTTGEVPIANQLSQRRQVAFQMVALAFASHCARRWPIGPRRRSCLSGRTFAFSDRVGGRGGARLRCVEVTGAAPTALCLGRAVAAGSTISLGSAIGPWRSPYQPTTGRPPTAAPPAARSRRPPPGSPTRRSSDQHHHRAQPAQPQQVSPTSATRSSQQPAPVGAAGTAATSAYAVASSSIGHRGTQTTRTPLRPA